MSTTIIEKLLADGDTISGKVLRPIAGLAPDGHAHAVGVDHDGVLKTRVEQRDLFNRVATAEPFSLYTMRQTEQAVGDLNTVQHTVGGASITYDTNTSSRDLIVGTADGDRAVFQSREYIPYEPGRTQQLVVTGTPGSAAAGVERMMGIFDDNNGIFLKQTNTGISFVIRSDTSGSVVETSVAQASWNVDPLDGTGNSGLTLDLSKFTILVIEFGWLGGAGVNVGFAVNGTFYYAHRFDLTTNVVPLVRTPTLPLRWEIKNVSTSSGATLKATCCAAFSLGGFDPRSAVVVNRQMLASRSISDASFTPILSVRLKSGFTRGIIVPVSFSIITEDNVNLAIRIVLRGSLTGASYTATDGPGTEYDESATALTGGIGVSSAFVSRSGGRALADVEISTALRASSDYNGVADNLTLLARTLSGTGSVWGSLTWREVF